LELYVAFLAATFTQRSTAQGRHFRGRPLYNDNKCFSAVHYSLKDAFRTKQNAPFQQASISIFSRPAIRDKL